MKTVCLQAIKMRGSIIWERIGQSYTFLVFLLVHDNTLLCVGVTFASQETLKEIYLQISQFLKPKKSLIKILKIMEGF